MEPKRFFRNFFPKKIVYRIIEPTDCKSWHHRISKQTKRSGGMPRTARTTENVYVVESHVLSQEDRPGTHITIPRISRETLIFREGNYVIIFSGQGINYMLESSKFVCSNLNKHNFGSCWQNSIKFSETTLQFITLMICKILSNFFQSWQIYWQNKKGISSIETQCINL